MDSVLPTTANLVCLLYPGKLEQVVLFDFVYDIHLATGSSTVAELGIRDG